MLAESINEAFRKLSRMVNEAGERLARELGGPEAHGGPIACVAHFTERPGCLELHDAAGVALGHVELVYDTIAERYLVKAGLGPLP